LISAALGRAITRAGGGRDAQTFKKKINMWPQNSRGRKGNHEERTTLKTQKHFALD
jgi:hypothetical protein